MMKISHLFLAPVFTLSCVVTIQAEEQKMNAALEVKESLKRVFANLDAFAKLIDKVKSGEITVFTSIGFIKVIDARGIENLALCDSQFQALTYEEKEMFAKLIEADAKFLKLRDKHSEEMTRIRRLLLHEEYFGSLELQKACEDYLSFAAAQAAVPNLSATHDVKVSAHEVKESLQCVFANFDAFAKLIDEIKSGEVTISTSIGLIEELDTVGAENLALCDSQFQALTHEEKEIFAKLIEADAEFLRLRDKHSEEMTRIRLLLLHEEYFGSLELQKACEGYLSFAIAQAEELDAVGAENLGTPSESYHDFLTR